MKAVIVFVAVFACIISAVYGCTHGAVQLANGGATNQGRVEVCVGQTWGTVCDDGFNSNDARVVCHQLGYDVDRYGTYTYKSSAYYGQGSGSIWLDDVQCVGTEQRLLDCKALPIGEHNCGHYEDVGVVCSGTCVNGAVRLIGGLVSTEGIVQMCVSGRWRKLCYNDWGYQEAFVVCRQLGLPATDAVATSGTNFFIPKSVEPLYSNFHCYGNESSLMDCLYSSSLCTHSSRIDAAVRCVGDIVSGTCLQGRIRLVGSNGPNTVEGRVEYCSNNVWGTTSSSGFDTRDGEVVCRKIGYQHPRAQIFSSSSFGQGTGPVLFTSLSCTGSEYSLADCPQSTDAYYSSHGSDVGVRCLQKVATSCAHGAVRLMNGSTSDEGRVEMCVNGEWGHVCGSDWYRQAAQVVCRQLGKNPPWAIYYRNSIFGDGTLPILAQSFSCSGTENSLLSCGGTIGYSTCYHGSTAGVRCFSSTGCANGAVRLVNGRRPSEGSVQICVNGVWGHVCGNYWSTANAKVVCSQLGYTTTLYSASYSLFSGGSQQPIIYGRVSCSGSEQTLASCSKEVNYDSYCQTYKAGVVCEVPSNCISGDVQLVNGSSDGEGRVEVCYQGVWTTVDGYWYYWDYRDARVLCRQLGYDDKWAVAIRDVESGKQRMVYQYYCSGSEVSLQSCSKHAYESTSYNAESWYSRVTAAVECQQDGINITITCTMEGATRLVSGSTEREGRVEVCHDGYWGTVCSDSWTEADAYVVCRQTGGNRMRAIPVTDGHFGKGVGPVHMSRVHCNGDEMRLLDCSHSNGVGVTNCHHGRDAGVVCEESTKSAFYEVSIEAKGSLSIGSTITLHCNVTPRPHPSVAYMWRTTAAGSILHTSAASSPNATGVIRSYHTKHGYYYCTVKQSGATIGTGVTRLEIDNILQPAVPVPLMATTGSDVTLRVNVTETDKNTYLRELTWYHNGVKINPTSNTRLNLSSDNTSLSISSVTDSDAGEYRVQYDGLRLYPHDAGCERQVLDLFRRYPLLAPAVLHLSTDGSTIKSQPRMLSSVSAMTHKQFFNTTTSHIDLVVNVDQSVVVDYLRDYWFHNGKSLSRTIHHFVPHFDKQAKFTFTNPTIFYSGVYETQMRVNTHTLLSSMCDNPSPYTSLMGTNTAVIGSDVQQLLYSETPSTELTAVSSSLPAGHTTTVTCTGRGGYPPVNSISLYKNNELLMSSSSGVLQYNTNNRTTTTQYGIYKCLIDYRINTIQRQLLLQEQAQLIVRFQFEECSTNLWNVSDFDRAFTEFAATITPQSVVFINSSLTCSSPSSLQFNSTLVFSTDDGSLTATDLINFMKSQLTLGGQLSALKVRGMNLTVLSFGEEKNVNSLPSFLGLFFGGVATSTFFWIVIITLLIIFTYHKWNSKKLKGKPNNEARYSSGIEAVTLPKDHQSVTHQQPASHNPTVTMSSKQKPVIPANAPPSIPKKCSVNPSYGYAPKYTSDDDNVYEALSIPVGGEEEYGGEYECV